MTRRRDPSPPINPPEPDHHHEDHLWDMQPQRGSRGMYLDGPGRSASESLSFEPGDVVHINMDCRRDGCDATREERHYTDIADMRRCEACGCETMFEGNAEIVDRTGEGFVIEKSCPARGCDDSVQVVTKESTASADGFACTGAPPR